MLSNPPWKSNRYECITDVCETHSCHRVLRGIDEAHAGLTVLVDDRLALAAALAALGGYVQALAQVAHAAGAPGYSIANPCVSDPLAKTYIHGHSPGRSRWR